MPYASRTVNKKQLTINKSVNCQLSSVKCHVKPKGFTLIELLIACNPKPCSPIEALAKMGRRKAIQGFTLIELLIVISIISILATLTLASYGGAQQKSRDGVRKSDFAQIKRGLELAKSDCRNGAFYPYVGNFSSLKSYLKNNNYISLVPDDPKSPTQAYTLYQSVSNGDPTTCPPDPGAGGTSGYGSSDYTLVAQLERTTDQDGKTSWERCLNKPYAGGIVSGSYPSNSGIYLVCNS